MIKILIETFKDDVRNGFGKVSWYFLKYEMFLGDIIHHLISIKWFFKPTNTEIDVFYDISWNIL